MTDMIKAISSALCYTSPDNFEINPFEVDDVNMDHFGILSPPASAVDSTESNSTATSPMSTQAMSPATMHGAVFTVISDIEKPKLVIIEQPVEKFRFRYKSEMMGTHGSLTGRNSDKSRKYTYPTVELRNYFFPAVIRCTLFTADEVNKTMHAHRLVSSERDDPHDIEVNSEKGYRAIFANMGIIHTAKKFAAEELFSKKKRIYLEKHQKITLTSKETGELKRQALEETSRMNLNTACLCFEGFTKTPDGHLQSICEPIFSDPINNKKSALTGDLKICRIDKTVGSVTGDEEVFILVEKVIRKNIKVRFFEMDDEDTRIWQAEGTFSELDVHHQYAIVFRTPAYRDREIDEPVDVFIELYRPSDGECSEPRPFKYKPAPRIGEKRARHTSFDSCDLPTTLLDVNRSPSRLSVFSSGELSTGARAAEALDHCIDEIDSDEFQAIWNNAAFVQQYKETFENDISAFENIPHYQIDSGDLRTDGNKNIPMVLHEKVEYQMCYSECDVPPKKQSTVSKVTDIEKTIAIKVANDIKHLNLNTEDNKHLSLTLKNLFQVRTNNDDTALHTSIMHNLEEQLRLILKALSKTDETTRLHLVNSCNKSGQTPLHVAVVFGRKDIINPLFRIGADLSISDICSDSALHLAAKYMPAKKAVEMVEELLQCHIKIEHDIENDWGLTPLHLAAQANNIEVVKMLINSGANVHQKCKSDGNTILHISVNNGSIDLLKYLLNETQINVDEQNYSGNTALHIAVVQQNAEMCKLLKAHNADHTIPNFSSVEIKREYEDDEEDAGRDVGLTSMEFATNNNEILKILKTENCTFSPETTVMETDTETTFDATCRKELASLLDESGLWKKLCQLLEYRDHMAVLSQAESPTKMLLSIAEINMVSVYDIRSLLEILDVKKGVVAIDDMLQRQFHSSE